MQFRFEKYYPIVISLLLTICLWLGQGIVNDVPGLIDKVSDNAIGLSVTLVGFFLTILTIINSVETRRMEWVRSEGLFPRLIKYLNQSIRFNTILLAFSFLIKYIEHRYGWLSIAGRNILDYVFIFFLMWTLLVSLRFTNVFVRLLSDPKTKKS